MRRIPLSFKILLLLLLSFLLSPPSYGDTIRLKNGNVFEGIVVDSDGDHTTVKLDVGTMTFTNAEIESIGASSAEEKDALEKRWKIEKQRAKTSQLLARPEAGPVKEEKKKPATTKKRGQKRWRAPAEISWIENYAEGISKAKIANKPAMIDFYTEWCGWCKKLDKDTLSNPKVQDKLKEFTLLKLDAEVHHDTAAEYGVTGYPTTLILDQKGKLILKQPGYMPPKGYLKFLDKAAAQAPEPAPE